MSIRQRRWYPLGATAAPAPRRGAAASRRQAARTPRPVDPLEGPKLALAGRVVTMDDAFTVRAQGVVYAESGRIVAVQDRTQPPPAAFDGVRILETGGTLFPGLIELHNHLSYNALPLWFPVPKEFGNRDQWARLKDYRKLISGPMTVLGKTPRLLPSLVRYVEMKCLLGGVTTSQGIRLASNAGVGRFYRGIVRNVEQTDDPDLPEVDARIPDVAAKDAKAFLARLDKASGRKCLLLHLSEGTDESARKHFLALEVAPGKWAINDALAGIHAAALTGPDFDVLARNKGAMVWSPLSNLLLYGDTAHVDLAKAAGVRIGLGSDWSPSGSKNLLGELKVASLVSESRPGGLFRTREIVAMATRNGAAILKWSNVLGSLEAGKRADILVIEGAGGDPYDALIKAKETGVRLVMINGVARYGIPRLMDALVPLDQTFSMAGEKRRLFLKQETSDPDVAQAPLDTATATLGEAFRDIVKLARDLERRVRAPVRRAGAPIDHPEPVTWSLALDEIQDTGVDLRPRLPFDGPADFTGPRRTAVRAAVSEPLSKILEPVALDPLTVAEDENFLTEIGRQPNLPKPVREGLARLY